MKRSFACFLLAVLLSAPLGAQGFLKGKILYFDTSSYYLGSVGDRVFMHPGSSGTLVGPSSTQLYYKDLLDSLGVRIQSA